MIKILKSEDVYKRSDLTKKFKNTSELEKLENVIIGQEKAREALNYGLSVNEHGYNIFVTGESSSKRKEYLKKVLNEFANSKDVPKDIVCVNNFEKENSPVMISFNPGEGELFKKDVEDFTKFVKEELINYFNSNNYSKELELLEQKYDYELYEISEHYETKIREANFVLSMTNEGYMAMPLDSKGRTFANEKKLNKYISKNQKKYMEDKNKVNAIILEMIHAETDMQKEKETEIEEFDKNKVSEMIVDKVNSIIEKYNQEKITTYMESIKDYILDNINIFKAQEETRVVDANGNIGVVQEDESIRYENYFNKTFVNLLVDNKDLKNAPVIFSKNIDEYSLFGGVIFNTDIRLGITNTDFSKIIAGDIVKANGGYLVIDIEDVLTEELWSKFKKVIRNSKINFSSRVSNGVIFSDSVESEYIPIDLKIILVGDEDLYYHLYYNDWEFRSLFQVHSRFETTLDRNEYTEMDYARLIATHCRENNMNELTSSAVERIIEYSSRIADEKSKLMLCYYDIYRVLIEANYISKRESREFINRDDINIAIKNQDERVDIYTKGIIERENDGTYIVTVTGEKVGEINALAVLDYGEFSLGRVNKLTVNTYASKGYGVISVDKDADMSGPLHNKCISIIKGFIGERFAKKNSISLSINISFEQSYGGIDGDSATLAETCAILSNLSGYPIKQNVAITGSMNQKGDVQGIGGVNHKIEGFYRVCKNNNSLEGSSVVIPKSNIKELMLSDEVVKSIEDGVFTIYAIDKVEEAVELLMGKTYDEVVEKIKL